MKILHVGKFYYPFHGGIETVTRLLAEGAVELGHEVTVLCFAHMASEGFIHPSTVTYEMIHGVRVIRVSAPCTIRSQPISWRLFLELYKCIGKFDIIHFHSPNPLAEFFGLILIRRSTYVVTYHCDVTRQKWMRFIYWKLLRRFLRRSTRVLVASSFHIQYSKILPEFRDLCTIIPFGLDVRRFQPQGALAAEKFARMTKELRAYYGSHILYVGRFVKYKGLEYLVEAMLHVDAKLIMIGDGPQLKEIQDQIIELGLSDRVVLLGAIEDDLRVAAHYEVSDLFVLPSIDESEAFGMVLIEAMFFGKPLVTTRISSAVNFVNQDNVTGLHVNPKDSAQLSDAINRILQDNSLRLRLGRQARARFEEVFMASKMIASHVSIYEDAIIRSQTRPNSEAPTQDLEPKVEQLPRE